VADFLAYPTSGERRMPITSDFRQVPALWNLTGRAGLRSGFVGWWASYPAEPVQGYMISNLVPFRGPRPGAAGDEGEDALRLGPIPKGTPVNLLANINLELSLDPVRLLRLGDAILKIKKSLKIIKRDNLNAEQSTALLSELVDDVLEVSKCPDFVVDRGHYYGTDLEDADKRALIGFLKTI
jgi:hypothetical protein